MQMRTNKYGIRGLKGVKVKGNLVYFWTPPRSLQRAGIFRYETLGADFTRATGMAREWNDKLDAYRAAKTPPKPSLGKLAPMTVAFLLRQYERSPKFAYYSRRTQQEYSWAYRNAEVEPSDNGEMFGQKKMTNVTRQIAYALYEQLVLDHGHNSANKTTTALQAAFRYGMLKFVELTFRPSNTRFTAHRGDGGSFCWCNSGGVDGCWRMGESGVDPTVSSPDAPTSCGLSGKARELSAATKPTVKPPIASFRVRPSAARN
jgi:hypothetical protein